MDYIELKGMTFFAFHGVMEQEKKVGNIFTVDLRLGIDLTKASTSDQLEDTINYAEIYQIIKGVMQVSSDLLEHVAGRIIREIKQAFPNILETEVRIAKMNPPLGGDIQSAAVILKK